MITEQFIHMKRDLLGLLDSSFVGFAYIITALSLNDLNWIYKALMIFLGLILTFKGWYNMKEARLKKENSEIELKLKKLEYEKRLEEINV